MTKTLAICRSNVRHPMTLVKLHLNIQEFADIAYNQFTSPKQNEFRPYEVGGEKNVSDYWTLNDDEFGGSEIARVFNGFREIQDFSSLPKDITSRSLLVRSSMSDDICVMLLEPRYRLDPHRAFGLLRETGHYVSNEDPGLVIPKILVGIIRMYKGLPTLCFDKFSHIEQIFDSRNVFDERSMVPFNKFVNYCVFKEDHGKPEDLFELLDKQQKKQVANICLPRYDGQCVLEILDDQKIKEYHEVFAKQEKTFPVYRSGKFVLSANMSKPEIQLLLDVLTHKFYESYIDGSFRFARGSYAL